MKSARIVCKKSVQITNKQPVLFYVFIRKKNIDIILYVAFSDAQFDCFPTT